MCTSSTATPPPPVAGSGRRGEKGRGSGAGACHPRRARRRRPRRRRPGGRRRSPRGAPRPARGSPRGRGPAGTVARHGHVRTAVCSATIDAAEQPEAHLLEAAALEQRGELLGAGEATHARREVRVRAPAGEHLAEQRHDPVEPEREERPQDASGLRDLEDREPPSGPQHAPQLGDAPASRSATFRTPKPTVAASKVSSANGSARRSPSTHSTVGDFRRARSSIAAEKSSPVTWRRSAPPRPRGRRCRSTRRGRGRRAHDGLDREPAPLAVEPGRHHAVHRVVDRRDAVEHAAHGVRLRASRTRGSCCAAPPLDERVVDAELVEAARDDEVDEVLRRVSAPW